MNRTPLAICVLLGLWTAAVAAVGCAGFRMPDTSVPDIAHDRRERADSTAADFDARRDFAEFQAALNCRKRGDVDGCRDTLGRLLGRTPDHLEARLLAADVCLERGAYNEALMHVEAAEAAKPGEPRVHHTKALVLDAMGKPDVALAHYKQAAELAPEEESFAASYQAAARAAAEPGADALPLGADIGLALATDEPRREATLSTGCAEDAGFNDAHLPGDVPTLLKRGAAALASDQTDTALACYAKAIRTEPDNPRIGISAAVESLRANEPELAIELLGPLAERFPDSVRLRQVLGTAFYRAGHYGSSQVALQQALSLDKSSALTYFLMGCTLATLGQQESAAAHLRQARTLDPRFTAVSARGVF